MSHTTNQPGSTAAWTQPQPAQAGPSTTRLVIIAACIAILAGGFGALIAAVGFPAKNGKVGATGPAGHAGPQGQQGLVGPSGNAANVDTNRMGYCFTYQTFYNQTTGEDYVTNVTFSPPTDNNGALSCPVGTFVSLTPNTPQGSPVQGYAPTVTSQS